MVLKEIELQFENCEYVTINGKYVGDFLVDDIKKSFARLASNAINPLDECGKFMVELSDDANELENVVNLSNWGEYTRFNKDVFSGIKQYDDITGFRFVLIDGDGVEHEYSYLPIWEDKDHNGEENLYQKSYISKTGFMYIVIGKDITIQDFPMYECIDLPDYAEDIKSSLELWSWDSKDDKAD